MDKHSSLLRTLVNYDHKSFITLSPGRDTWSSIRDRGKRRSWKEVLEDDASCQIWSYFFLSSLTRRQSKLECWYLTNTFPLLGPYIRAEVQLPHTMGRLLTLLPNTRLNMIQAFYVGTSVTKKKSAITLAPGANIIKLFSAESYDFS
jgi:hypothetical protein